MVKLEKMGLSLKESYFYQLSQLLFLDNLKMKFSDSFFGKYLVKISVPYAADLALILAIGLLWFEPLLDARLPLLGSDFLPPLILGIGFILSDKNDFKIRKYHLWYLLFLVLGLISAILSLFIFNIGIMVVLGWLVFAQFLLALILGELLTVKYFLPAVLFLSAPLLAKGFWQFFSGTGRTYSYLETSGVRISSFFESPNTFAFILVLILLLLFVKFFSVKNKILYSLLFIPYSFLLILTGSRTAIMAFFVGILAVIFFEKRNLLKFAPLSGLVLFIPRIRERFTVVFSQNYRLDNTIDGRGWTLNNSFHIFNKYPLFGTGPGTFGGKFAKSYASPVYFEGMQNGYVPLWTTDNQFLAVLVQTGIFGSLAFLGFLSSLFSALYQKRVVLGLAVFASFLVMMLFANALEFSAVSFLVAGIIGSELKE